MIGLNRRCLHICPDVQTNEPVNSQAAVPNKVSLTKYNSRSEGYSSGGKSLRKQKEQAPKGPTGKMMVDLKKWCEN